MTSIVDKVRKLLRLAESPNANEAALAAAKAQELIDQHNLSAALLALEDEAGAEPDEPIEDFRGKGAPLYTESRDSWRWRLASVVMHANSCRGYKADGAIQIVGRPSDVETVRYLYAYLAHETDRLVERDGRGCGRTWRNNYRIGVVSAIAGKFTQQRERFKAEQRKIAAGSGDSQALVKVDKALARVEKRGDDVKAWIKQNLKLYAGSSSGGRRDASAREAGYKAGQSIQINRARRSLAS